ncbi:hypothetical protein EW026_g8391 [Hermanssonia centrifuga]|uniref:RNase H type-1 domain-containing protein n=1 Tax=Hermanssonia centrifuga TaxID=98765 RepID=A0A4V3X939_9APHY|nr:hypothetical protein EW026_g8391 [Hermanssonia centrifuga]
MGNNTSLFYVDDGNIIVSSDSPATNAALIGGLYQALERELTRKGLSAEQTKFELMHFLVPRRGKQDPVKAWPMLRHPPDGAQGPPNQVMSILGPSVYIRAQNGTIVPVIPTDVLRYLGFFLDPKLNFNAHIERCAAKASSTVTALRMLGNSIRGLGPLYKRRLYIANVVPVMTYGMQLWWHPTLKNVKRHMAELAKVQAKAARWITGGFRTTPIGALNALAGLPPIKERCRHLMNKAALRVRKLPDSHPIRAVLPDYWTVNQVSEALPFQSVSFRKPDNTPIRHIDRVGRSSNEDFARLHPENRPGDRLLEEFPNRIKFCLSHPPKSKKEEFEHWYENTFVPKLRSLTWGFEGKEGIYIVFTDGSAKKTVRADKPTRYRSSSSYLILKQSLENNRHVKHATLASGKATSYDAEIMALAAGIKNAIRAGGADLRELHVFADNQTALRNIVEPGLYSGQMFTLSVIKDLRRFLCESPEHLITLHWCPAHVGVPQNEFVDQLAKSGLKRRSPDYRSFAFAAQMSTANMYQAWRAAPGNMGKNWLCPAGGFPLSHTAKSPLIANFGKLAASITARITRVVTGHLPIGEFRQKFNFDGPKKCLCGQPLETRNHMLFDCPIWKMREPDFTKEWLTTTATPKQFIRAVANFLSAHPLAGSFELADAYKASEEENQTLGTDAGPLRRALLQQLKISVGRWRLWQGNEPIPEPNNETPEEKAAREARNYERSDALIVLEFPEGANQRDALAMPQTQSQLRVASPEASPLAAQAANPMQAPPASPVRRTPDPEPPPGQIDPEPPPPGRSDIPPPEGTLTISNVFAADEWSQTEHDMRVQVARDLADIEADQIAAIVNYMEYSPQLRAEE